MSNAAFTYDNLNLAKLNRENRQQLGTITGICKTLGSSLRDNELLHVVLHQLRENVPFDIAAILGIRGQLSDHSLEVLDILSSIPFDLNRNGGYDYSGSILEGVVRQGSSLLITQTEGMQHPLDRELFVKPGLQASLVVPLKIGGTVTGLLLIGAVQPGALAGLTEKVEEITPTLSLAMEKNRLSASVTKRDREMESIKQIGSILAASTFEREEVLKSTMDMIRTIMNVEAGSLLLLEKDELAFKVAFNISPGSQS